MIDAAFWQARWDEGKIGFHEGRPNRWLARRVDVLEGDPAGPRTILVPLAGKAIDVAWLAGRGHRVIAVEVVERAVADFFAERGVTPERSRVGAFERWRGGTVDFLCGDVFAVTPEVIGALGAPRVDAVYDRAALIALDPADRARYVATTTGVLAPGGRVLLVGFQHGLADGPPFDLTPDAVTALYAPHGAVTVLGEDDVTDESPQFRARGATRCLEAGYRIDVA